MSRNNAGSSISKPIRKAVPAFEADEKHDYEGNSSSAETPIAVPQQQHQPSFDPSLMRSTAVVANASTTPVGSTGGGGASSEVSMSLHHCFMEQFYVNDFPPEPSH